MSALKWFIGAAVTGAASVQAAHDGSEQAFSTFYKGEENTAHFTAINGKLALIETVEGKHVVDTTSLSLLRS